jgi:hypothetical protein
VRNFAKLRTKDVYPGVDVVYYGDNRRLEFDFVVAPMADPRAIALTLSGMDKLYINADGELVAEVNGHPVTFAKPYAYQKVAGSAQAVSVEYALAGPGKAQLQIGDYDKNLELVIDPLLSYSTYLGGSQGDTANGIVVDPSGNAYITGQTHSLGRDATPIVFPSGSPNNTGTIPEGDSSSCDAYVTKLDPTGQTVLFTTFISGTTSTERGCASGNGIALDDLRNASPVPNGYTNVYVVGTTNFQDIPSPNPLGRSTAYNNGDHDAFIAILDSGGPTNSGATPGALIRTSYLGGGLDDQGFAIAVDSQQNVIVTGQTDSHDFPAYNGFEPKTEDYVAFITKLDFGLHIARTSAGVFPLIRGASAMTPRPTSFTDTCGSPPAACPLTANINPASTYYFFSALYGGQLVPPEITWPTVNGTYPDPTNYGKIVVPPFAITVATPSTGNSTNLNCPGNISAQVLVALSSATVPQTAQGLDWIDICTAIEVGNPVVDAGGFSWLILGPKVIPIAAATRGYGVALDPGGDVFAVGGSSTANLEPSLPGAAANFVWLPTPYQAGTGAWIVKLLGRDTHLGSLNAGATVYLRALGINPADDTQVVNAARGVAVDADGKAYVVGTTTGGIYTTGSLNQSPLGPAGTTDAFLFRINSAGSGKDYGIYLGGSGNDQGLGVAIDASGSAYVIGSTQSTDVPVINPLIVDNSGTTLNQLKGTPPNAQNAYIARISPAGSQLTMSAYLGGSGNSGDQGNAIALSTTGTGDIYVAGNTSSTDFPLNPPAPAVPVFGRSAYAGDPSDAFVTKIDGTSFPLATISPTSLNFGNQAVGFSSLTTKPVTLSSTGSAPLSFVGTGITASGDFTQSNNCGTGLTAVGGGKASCTITVTFTPTAVGTRSGTLTIVDNASNSPQTVGLTGNGVLVLDSVLPGTLAFGSQVLGTTTAAQTVTVKNIDPAQTLIISSTPVVTGDFALGVNTCITLLLPGQSCTIGVTFTPTVPGSRIGTLIVNGNGNDFPNTVQLTGTGNGAGSPTGGGTAPSVLTITPSTTSLTVTKGTPATFTVTLTAPNSFNQSVTLACTATGGATCTITQPSPNPVTGAAPSTATVTVSVPAGNTITIGNLIRSGRLLAMLLPFGGIGLVLVGRRRRWLLVLGLLVCLAFGMVGCGGGGGSSSSSQPPQVTITGTPQTGNAPPPIIVSLSVS